LKTIKVETDRLDHLRDAFPLTWFKIKDKLAGTRKSFLDFEEYRKLCNRLGETDPSSQELLATYLHILGIALNYRDDPRLKDTHVLNPRWVTNGIYDILNSTKLETQKGDIQLEDLYKLLNPKVYPPKMLRFLVDLMIKFDLCFSFPNDDTHYLIPELLDNQEPDTIGAFQADNCLNFEYHYSVLPEGLLPRFIVRTNVLSEGRKLSRWRSGVILQFEGCSALVKADTHDKKIFIRVSSPEERSGALGRRRLLAVIRSHFEEIHQSIPRLRPQEMVPIPSHPNTLISYEKLLAFEQAGIKHFDDLVDGEIKRLSVHTLLNGVDIEGSRRATRIVVKDGEAKKLFVSYSHKDETLLKELNTHLKLLQREGLINLWHDRKIEAGNDWKQSVNQYLEHSDIILLLMSADFIASDYCYEVEMKRALERAKEGVVSIIPIILREVASIPSELLTLQTLPKDGKPVTTWRHRDAAWRNVAEGIR
jgi:internalin A